jgi:hypothetical protein
MADATHSGFDELARLARGLQEDLVAIKAGLTLEWSDSVSGGHSRVLIDAATQLDYPCANDGSPGGPVPG